MVRCWRPLLRSAVLAAIALALIAGPVGADDNGTIAELRENLSGGDLLAAENGARELLPQVEATAGPDSLAVAQVLDVNVESRLRQWFYTDPEVHELAERALAIKERLLGPEDARLVDSLANRAEILLVGHYCPFEAELDHSHVVPVGQVVCALAVVQVVGVCILPKMVLVIRVICPVPLQVVQVL